jgi:WD40 repeat protein
MQDAPDRQWARFSNYLDRALEISEAELPRWLAALRESDPGIAGRVEDALKVRKSAGFSEFLVGASLLPADALATATLIGRRVGPYEIDAEIGRGGMGSVWRARRADGRYEGTVAIKFVHAVWIGQAGEQRFLTEGILLGRLDHPNIARLLDAGILDGTQPYLILEYVEGEPIDAHCDRRRLGVIERAQLFLDVLAAVAHAHSHLIVHRDLKPSNVLVSGDGTVKLLDFGIAKLLEGDRAAAVTRSSATALTPQYAAPEQITGAPITTATDVYALGVMLYEQLTGQHPYGLRHESRRWLEDAILQAEPKAPSLAGFDDHAAAARGTSAKKLARSLRGDLDAIVLRTLQKSPSRRYVAANALAEDISRFLRGEVVLAQRDSIAYRALKFARRHRFGIAVTAGVMLALAGGMAATTYEAQVASQERSAALGARARALTQTAAARLRDSDVPGAMAILVALRPPQASDHALDAEVLSAFQEARAADNQLLALTGHGASVQMGSYAPDGRRIVTASLDSTARVWDAGTGKQLLVLAGHRDAVWSAVFSADGRRIVTASYDGTARVWDAANGRVLTELRGHTGRVVDAAISPDGRRIVTASADRTARLWDAATGKQLAILAGHTDTVRSAAFAPDGQRVVTASYDKTARIWNVITGREVLRLNGHTNQVWRAVFSPDGRRIATASFDETARIWDSSDGRQLLVLAGHRNVVTAAAFSPDGTRVATSSEDKTARLWDTTTGRELALLDGHTDMVTHAGFSPDGRRLVTSCLDATARIWEVPGGREILALAGHADLVSAAEFSADGRQVLTSSWDGVARLWNATTGGVMHALDPKAGHMEFASRSRDGARLVTAGDDTIVRIWDVDSGRQLFALGGHTDRVETVAFSPDGRRVVSASWDRTGRVWDTTTGRPLLVLRGHADKLDYASFSPDGRQIVTASFDRTARIWDAATGAQLTVLAGHSQRLSSALFSPDGKRVVTAASDRTARVWNPASGAQLLVLRGHRDIVEMAAYSPDATRIVTASYDHTARIWDAATSDQLTILSGHSDLVETAAYAPDGLRVVTASDDGTARIWDAHVLDLATQFNWAEAALFERLQPDERFEFGLPAATDERSWPQPASACDAAAAATYDPDRRSRGVVRSQMVAAMAIAACARDEGRAERPRRTYQHGRALAASGDWAGAIRELEEAQKLGYRTAAIDLAALIAEHDATERGGARARSLLEAAWHDGVTAAAFELGRLYEGAGSGLAVAPAGIGRDLRRAFDWYDKGARAGEPSALARLAAAAEDAALAAPGPAQRRAHLLDAFRCFAAAAERARLDDWPDEAWRNWRFRRASLARVLAAEGVMADVAQAYAGVRGRYASSARTLGQRVAAAITGHRPNSVDIPLPQSLP